MRAPFGRVKPLVTTLRFEGRVYENATISGKGKACAIELRRYGLERVKLD